MTLLYLDGTTRGNAYGEVQRSAPLPAFDGTGYFAIANPLGGNGFGGNSTSSDRNWFFPDGGSAGPFYCGFRFYFEDNILNTTAFFTIGEVKLGAVLDHLVVRIDAGGSMRLFLSNTQIDVSVTNEITTKRWHYFEMSWTIHDTTGAYDIRIDGVSIMSDTNVDTRFGGEGISNRLSHQQTFQRDWAYSDFYLCDGNGSLNNGFLGEIHVETLTPDADGNRNNFTPLSGLTNYEMVDDGDGIDDDTTYVSSATAGDDELYSFTTITNTADNVYGVQVRAYARKEDAGFRELSGLCRETGATEANTARLLPPGDPNFYRDPSGFIFEQNPSGPANWTTTTVNSSEFGVTINA